MCRLYKQGLIRRLVTLPPNPFSIICSLVVIISHSGYLSLRRMGTNVGLEVFESFSPSLIVGPV